MEPQADQIPQQNADGAHNTLKAETISQGLDPLSMIRSTPTQVLSTQKSFEESKQVQSPQKVGELQATMSQLSGDGGNLARGIINATFNESYIDQVKQTKQVKEVESTNLLEPGEVVVICFDKIKELKTVTDGKIYITNYRILFIEMKEEAKGKRPTIGPLENEVFNYYTVPIGYVGKYKFSIEKKEHHFLDLDTKDGRKFKFRFDTAFSHQRMSDAMSRHCEITKHRDLFTFDHSKFLKDTSSAKVQFLNDQIVVEQVIREYDRMGVTREGAQLFKRVSMDEMTRVKRKIDLPTQVIIPSGLGEDDHLKCGYNRTNGRFPTLTYQTTLQFMINTMFCYNRHNGLAIWRSSEQNYDLPSTRRIDDETLIKSINKTADQICVVLEERQQLLIFNAADKKLERQTLKFPHENVLYYEKTKQIYYSMNDNKQVGQAFNQLWEICQNYNPDNKKFLPKIEKSNWFRLINRMLKKAVLIRDTLMSQHESPKAKNVLIYCSNGNGPSCLLSSLAQILIDPFYRTFEGLKQLILKDWVYYGHNFMKSLNINNEAVPSLAEQSFAPLFILFLDCIYQLQQMNDTEFEFTEGYIVYLGYHCFSSKFFELTHLNPLNYLNSQQSGQPQSELVSIFSTVDHTQYLNKIYQLQSPDSDIRRQRPLLYDASNIQLWKSQYLKQMLFMRSNCYFGRYQPELRPTFESTQGPYSITATFEYIKNDNRMKSSMLYQNYLTLLEARQGSGEEELTHEEIQLLQLYYLATISVQEYNNCFNGHRT